MTNDAAERLQQDILNAAISGPDWDWDEAAATKVAGQALADERRAAVEWMEEEGVVTWGDERHRQRFLEAIDAEANR